jgi:hypothetical protein
MNPSFLAFDLGEDGSILGLFLANRNPYTRGMQEKSRDCFYALFATPGGIITFGKDCENLCFNR